MKLMKRIRACLQSEKVPRHTEILQGKEAVRL